MELFRLFRAIKLVDPTGNKYHGNLANLEQSAKLGPGMPNTQRIDIRKATTNLQVLEKRNRSCHFHCRYLTLSKMFSHNSLKVDQKKYFVGE